MLYYLTILRKI